MPRGIAKGKKRLTEEERKAKDKARRQTTEYKAKAKARKQTPEYKLKAKAAAKKYNARADIKIISRLRAQTPAEIKRRRERGQIPENKVKFGKYRKELRLTVMNRYSKLLSNTDVPCCNCCGINSHVDFLAIDHIRGREDMGSEPELVKLGYSSKLVGTNLQKWIVDNNFPDGFQVLCQNCNFAKGMKKNNNKCPMENKPH